MLCQLTVHVNPVSVNCIKIEIEKLSLMVFDAKVVAFCFYCISVGKKCLF